MASGPQSPALRRLERALPSRYYFDAQHHARELETFWYRRWLNVCRVRDLARPRDYAVVEVGDQSLLLTRTLGGEIRAFHNSCRHRGSILCPEPRGRFPGASIVCPYHGWTYSLDGELLGARHQLPLPDFCKKDFPLHRVAADEWGGFVFVHLEGESAPPLRDALGEIPADLAGWPLEELVVAQRATRRVRCNWKVFWENFSECFHCPGVHPELCALVPVYGRGLQSPFDDPGYRPPAGGGEPAVLAAGAVTWSPDGRALAAPFAGLGGEERRRGQTFGVSWPSFFLVAHVDHARAVRVLPRGPEEIELGVEWLFAPEEFARADFDRERAVAFGTRLVEQDARICELHQRGLHSRRFDTGVLVPQEYGVHAFQEWIRRGLGESG